MDMISIRRKLMATVKQSTVILATATGNPLSFVTDMVRPLKSLVIPFTPIQAAGTPSPDNPLPISGWTGCEIPHTGKNIFPNENGRTSNVFIPRNVVFTVSFSVETAGGYIKLTYEDGTDSGIVWINQGTSSDGLRRYRTISNGDKNIVKAIMYKASGLKECQIEFGNQSTPYEPYQGLNIPITFTDPSTGDPMTVYGGSLTLNEDGSADLVSTFKAFHLGSYNWRADTAASNTHLFYVDGWDSLGITDGTKYCSILLPTTTLNLSNWRGVNGEGKIGHGGSRLYIKPMTVSTAADAKVLMNGQYFIGTLNTPQTYHFDNIGQFITFLGTNTIWTDTNGTNTVTYLKHQS